MDTLNTLNPQQRMAVTMPIGPVLVQAGAGTGKTRVLTLRIAYLVKQHSIPPARILALTFTNKAAKELRERLRTLLGQQLRGLTSGTFHSVCARILRAEIGGRIGNYTSDFTIYAADEQLQVAAEALDGATERPPQQVEPEDILRHISRAKSRLIKPRMKARGGQGPMDAFTMGCYRRYQRILARSNALDFDDLILLTHQLFTEYPDVLDAYQERWPHLLVDEYQDTDPSQHALLEILTRPQQNGQVRSLFVVGDGMQSIYGFRNADHTIIANFTRDFPEAMVCNLTTNYRSRQPILDAAYAVIRHSQSVKPMELASVSTVRGERCLQIIDARDGRDEAEHIARSISDLEQMGRRLNEIAVIYRTRHLSRLIESALRHARIPYRVRGATGFYDRAVVRDALAYLRVIANPGDSLSLMRIATRPTRGLGAQSLAALAAFAAQHDITLLDALRHQEARAQLSAKATRGAQTLASLFARWQQLVKQTYPPSHLLSDVLERSGYLAWLEEKLSPEELPDAQEHLQELVNAAQEHTDLSSFLQEVALLTSADEKEDERMRVELLTIHAAKGLEWPVVFVAGLEEGTLPHERSLTMPGGIEEERRLCYVALTRAGELLYLSWANSRSRGKQTKPSRFLQEIETFGRERAGR
jgi:DNA helicase-2/ATP-dependent DNA helicase PcrA